MNRIIQQVMQSKNKFVFLLAICCLVLLVTVSGCSNSSSVNDENFHCEPETGSGPLMISVSTSRVSGVAPLFVFFDATGTTGLTNNCFFADNAAYLDATFSWNFDADNIDSSAKYKKASGFVAAHVFEKPGSYRVHLDVYDAGGKTASKDVTVTVTAVSGTTYYVSATGSDSNNDGLSMDKPFSTPEHALSSSILGPNVRVLFKNGDTFTISKAIAVTGKTGPIVIGAYSDPSDPSPDKPVINITAVDSDWFIMYFSNCSDVRIMDIAVTATAESSENPRYPAGIVWLNDCTHMLKYRTEEYQNGGMAMSPGGQYTAVAECVFHDTTGTGYSSSDGVNDGNALIGNSVYKKSEIDTHNDEHIYRLQGGSRYFIAHNVFGPNVKVNYDALTVRGNTEKVVIYKNRITGWVQDITPQNKNSAREYQHHCMVDSNLIVGQGLYDGDRGQALGARAKDVVYRNNIIYDYQFGIGIGNDTVVGYSRRIKVYNNTFINPRTDDYFNPVFLDAVCTNIEIKNNLMLDVGGGNSSHLSFLDIRDGSVLNGESDYNMFYGSGWSIDPNLFDGSNLTNWRSSTGNDLHSSIVNPQLLSVDYNDANFCMPQTGSPVINAGASTPSALDFNGNLRDGSRDIGACEHQ